MPAGLAPQLAVRLASDPIRGPLSVELEAGGDIGTLWGIEGVSAWAALDAEGRVIDMQVGRLTGDQIDELLRKAIG